jgi:murein L,D-transpeptidase YcbB/YkuD
VDQVDQRYGTQLMKNLFPWYGGSSDGAPFFMKEGRFISDDGRLPTTYAKQWLIDSDHYLKSNEYIPYPGDYIWFYYHSRREGTEHVAVVEGISRDEGGAIQVHVIEGNNPDRVQRAVYDLTDKRIYGFGTPVKRAYTNLRLYYQNADVAQLQKDLIALGYYQQEEKREGYFTPALKDAVKQFQKDAGISTSGMVDIQTRPALEKALDMNIPKEP